MIFYTTGILMPEKQEIISMVLPIRAELWKMQSGIFELTEEEKMQFCVICGPLTPVSAIIDPGGGMQSLLRR